MSLKERFRQIKKLPTWIYFFPALLMRAVFKLCYRFELVDPRHICDDPKKTIGMIWHNRLLFLPMVFDDDERPFHGFMRYDGDEPAEWRFTR